MVDLFISAAISSTPGGEIVGHGKHCLWSDLGVKFIFSVDLLYDVAKIPRYL